MKSNNSEKPNDLLSRLGNNPYVKGTILGVLGGLSVISFNSPDGYYKQHLFAEEKPTYTQSFQQDIISFGDKKSGHISYSVVNDQALGAHVQYSWERGSDSTKTDSLIAFDNKMSKEFTAVTQKALETLYKK